MTTQHPPHPETQPTLARAWRIDPHTVIHELDGHWVASHHDGTRELRARGVTWERALDALRAAMDRHV